jgi:hypothetical protein
MPKKTKNDPWLCGYAVALANVYRNSQDASLVRLTLRNDGITLEHLETAGAESYDLDTLRVVHNVGIVNIDSAVDPTLKWLTTNPTLLKKFIEQYIAYTPTKGLILSAPTLKALHKFTRQIVDGTDTFIYYVNPSALEKTT